MRGSLHLLKRHLEPVPQRARHAGARHSRSLVHRGAHALQHALPAGAEGELGVGAPGPGRNEALQQALAAAQAGHLAEGRAGQLRGHALALCGGR